MPFFPFVDSFTPWVIDMWLLRKISSCSQKLIRNENEHMGISSRNTDVPLKLINEKGGEEVI